MRGNRDVLDHDQWQRLAAEIGALSLRGPKGDLRGFLEAVVWILRTDAPWRDLAKRFGRWDRVYRRYRRWALAGRWDAVHGAVHRAALASGSAERRGLLLIDSTIVKAHPHAAGALRRTGGPRVEALGRSRGGFTTKLHALVTERGELVRYVLTGGEVNDITRARSLVVACEGGALVGHRAYDSDAFITHVKQLGMRAVIPSRSGRRHPRRLDRVRYARRNVIERWFGRMKAFRHVATRYEKTASSHAGFVMAAATLILLSEWHG